MHWLLYCLLIAILCAGLWINLLGLPGLWLMIAAYAAYGWATGWGAHASWSALALVAGIALVAEVAEFFSGALGAKSAGGSKRGILGAIVGGLLGAVFLTFLVPVPVLGTVVGVLAGTFLGAAISERLWVGKPGAHAAHIGVRAALGRLLGILIKTAAGLAILVYVLVRGFPG